MKRPIGIIDSGVGGLTVANEVIRQLPKESIIYLGDTLRCPYGPRRKDEIKHFTFEMVSFLLDKDIKLLIIACNTITAYTLDELQKNLKIPVLGVIQPGARTAIKTTKNNKVAVIGTEGTIKSNAYYQAIRSIHPKISVVSQACPLFVPMIENGILKGPEAVSIVKESLAPLKGKGIDTLVLGCTHYPVIRELISKEMGTKVKVISSGIETAREASALLDLYGIANKSNNSPEYKFYTTGEVDSFIQLSSKIFNKPNNGTFEKVELKTLIK